VCGTPLIVTVKMFYQTMPRTTVGRVTNRYCYVHVEQRML